MKRVLVIGSGVIGLTTAITLLQDGHVVTIWTEKLSRNTTVTSATDYAPEDLIVSDVAAASFIPHTKQPNEREVSWLAISSKMFMAEAAQPDSGVQLRQGCEHFATGDESVVPWFAPMVSGFKVTEDIYPYKFKWEYATPIIDTSIYLNKLWKQFERLGGKFGNRKVYSLEQLMEERNAIHFDFIVNCTGLASRHLAADMQLIPAFGQVLRCEYPADPSARAAISTWVRDSTGPNKVSYIYPRTHDIVLGGTYEEDPEYACKPQDSVSNLIQERCRKLNPAIDACEVVEVLGGWRPFRMGGAKVEYDCKWSRLIHNFGHGGEGYVFSWGSAATVLELIRSRPSDTLQSKL